LEYTAARWIGAVLRRVAVHDVIASLQRGVSGLVTAAK
jgi:hypothetical protein